MTNGRKSGAATALTLLLAINLFNYIDRYVLASVLPTLKQEFLAGDPNQNGKAGLWTRLFVGIGEAGYGPAAPTIIADLYPLKTRGRVLAWFYVAIPVGSALGYAYGGKVADLLNWRWAFYLVVPPGLLLAALCFFM